MGKEHSELDELLMPEIPLEEKIRQELLSFQKRQKQLSASETEGYIRITAEVIRARTLPDVKKLAARLDEGTGSNRYEIGLGRDFERRRLRSAFAIGPTESPRHSLNFIKIDLAILLVQREFPDTKFSGYAGRIIKHLANSEVNGRIVRTLRVRRRYL